MNYYKDKIAIVTGAGSGIGRALSLEMARQGAVVVVTDINLNGAEQTAQDISSAGGQASAACLDVAKAEDVKKIIDETVAKHGRLDFMFNNAGIATLGEVRFMTPEQWRQILDINLMGGLYGTLEAYAVMVKQGFGHIVNTASHAGLHPVAGSTAYGVAKHGMVGLSTALRSEGLDLGVRVSAICPGPVKTNIVQSANMVNLKPEFSAMAMSDAVTMKVDKAAKVMLKGVAKNKAIIVCPFYARVIWWLFRLCPGILFSMNNMMIRAIRKYNV